MNDSVKQISERRRILKKTHWQTLLPRVILGAIFTASGLNGLFNLVPNDSFSTEGQAFISAMQEGGFYTLLKFAELTAGILLIFNFAGQAGVLLLVPICLGILVFHWFLSPQGAMLGWIAVALEVLLIVLYRKNLMNMFRGKKDEAEVLHQHHEKTGKSDLGDWVLDN